MASIGSLIIDLIAKTGLFETDLGRAAKTAEKRAKEIDNSLSELGENIGSAFAGLAAAFSLNEVIEATSEAEKAMAALENAVRNNAGAAEQTSKGLSDLSGELQKVTTYSDDAIQGVSALLLSFKQIGGGVFQQAQQAVLDLSTALGKDLNNSALLVGRALADPIKGMTALGKAGVILSRSQQDLVKSLVDTGRLSEAQAVLLSELEKSYGGAAVAARNTFGGALEGLKNAFGDLLEIKSGIPGVTAAINRMAKALTSDDVRRSVDSLGGAIISTLTAIGAVAALVLKPLAGVINTAASLGTQIDMAFGRDFDVGTQIDVLNEKLEALKILRDSILNNPGDPGALIGPHELEELEKIRKKIEEIKKERDDLILPSTNSTGPIRRTRSSISVTQASGEAEGIDKARDSIRKLIATQEQQIAIYDKSASAAIAYRIAQGDLSDEFKTLGTDGAELAEKLIAVTTQFEKQVQAAEKQKEVAAEQKKIIEDRVVAQKQAQKFTEEMVIALESEVATFERGESAALAYNLAHGELGKQFELAGASSDIYREKLISLTAQLQVMNEASEGASESVAEFAAKNEEDLQSFSDSIGEQFETATAEWTTFKDQAARNTQDIIADMFINGFDDGVKGIIKSFAQMIIKLTAQAAAANIAEKLFGKAGSGSSGSGAGLLSGLFAGLFGARADGGPVFAGGTYLVGERGPELFKPKSAGSIVPNGAFGGGINITTHVDARGATTELASVLPEILRRNNDDLESKIVQKIRRRQYNLG